MDHWEDWQRNYLHGILVIWPPDEVRDIVNRQRKEVDPKSAAISEAHITLTQPLLRKLDPTGWDEIQKIASQFQPFEIEYGPLRSFLPYPCIWYDIQPMDKVLKIREALHTTGFFNLSLPHTDGFIPHMTITEQLSGPEVNLQLLEDLQAESSSGKFTLSEITLIEPDDEFTFHVRRNIPLG